MAYVFNPFTGTLDSSGTPTVGAFNATSTANGLDVAGSAISLHAADASNPGAITTIAQTIAGIKTFNALINADAGIDRSTSGTLTIGATNSSVINIGNAGATVNILGTTLYENVTQLQVADPVITLNKGAGVGSAANSGVELEENGIITGYVETSSDRNSWILKAPNTAGVVTITPGASGFTINQASHNPVTIGTANGLSLSTQALSLGLASAGVTGALSGTDWSTFNSKQVAGTYIKADGTQALTANWAAGNFKATINGVIIGNTTGVIDSLGSVTNGTGSFTFNGSGAIQVPNASDILVGQTTAATLTNKTIAAGVNTITGTAGGLTAGGNLLKSTGDIDQTTFAPANNNSSAAGITGLAFANASVRSAHVNYSIIINATSSLYESGTLQLTQKGASWDLVQQYGGDDSLLVFTINTSGQVQYTTPNYTGFTSAKLQFRAVTTAV